MVILIERKEDAWPDDAKEGDMMDDNKLSKPEKQQSPSAKSETQVYEAIRAALAGARTKSVIAVNSAMVVAYWEIGRELNDTVGERAEYGKGLLRYLSERLTQEFGKGFTVRNLYAMMQFHKTFEKLHTLCAELSWSHYRLLMKIADSKKRSFYYDECRKSGWTVRQLDRQIHSFYFERLLSTQKERREEIVGEVYEKAPKTQNDDLLKDPYVFEFLGMQEIKDYTETQLEQALIDKLQSFLLELGRGFAFVARQKRVTSEGGDHYYIDLVFYNYILKCFIIIDLKAGKLAYQDVGQIDFYRRLFDDVVKQSGDNPTIGIVLCSGKDESIVKYSVLADKENLYAANYELYLPTEEELQTELQRERELIEWQIKEEAHGGDGE